MKSRFITLSLIVTLIGANAHAFQLMTDWYSRQSPGELTVLRSLFIPRLHLFLIFAFLVAAIGLLTRTRVVCLFQLLAL